MGILRKLNEWRERADGTLEGPSIDAGEIKVGSSGPVTGLMGNSGEWWPLIVQRGALDHSTSSTSYVNVLGSKSRIRVNFQPLNSISGFSTLGIDFSASWDVPDGETLEAELYTFSGGNLGDTAYRSVTGDVTFAEFSSDVIEVSPPDDTTNIEVRIRTTNGNQCTLRTPTVTIYGKIE